MVSHDLMSKNGRILVLVSAFLGWLFAGVQLAVTSLVMRDAMQSMSVGESDAGEASIGQWMGWLVAAFLFGGAVGGYLFGWLGDKFGRQKAMSASIACYSLFAFVTYFTQTPDQLLWLRFATGLGVGGMWPNAIALVSEAWPNFSRPFIAGIIGTAANVGIMLFSLLTMNVLITPDAWRWTTLLCTSPILLSIFILLAVPESPKWLSLKQQPDKDGADESETDISESQGNSELSPLLEIFSSRLIQMTMVGIVLGTIPLFGGWGSSNWANFWVDQEGVSEASKAEALFARSLPGSIGSLLGGALAMLIGRRVSYFLLSFACLICSQYIFIYSHPQNSDFMIWYAALGLFSGFFFGWLPFCLPELFPTRVRSTGAGVSFNFGRIVTVVGILVAAGMLKEMLNGDYAQIGRITSWIYAIGMVVAFFIPKPQEDLER